MEKKKFCQSCAMPLQLHGDDMRGTEQNGSISAKYCQNCYQDGSYTNPNATFEEMLDIGKKGIDKGKGSKVVKSFMKWGYPYQLSKVERWKK